MTEFNSQVLLAPGGKVTFERVIDHRFLLDKVDLSVRILLLHSILTYSNMIRRKTPFVRPPKICTESCHKTGGLQVINVPPPHTHTRVHKFVFAEKCPHRRLMP